MLHLTLAGTIWERKLPAVCCGGSALKVPEDGFGLDRES